MSGLVHSIGKVFSAVWDFVKPIAKIIVIAAAIYFTAGMALAAFPATAGFAAALPGFAGGGFLGLGVGAGATAGTGIFSHMAAAIGMGGGLASGAAASSAASASALTAGSVTAGTGGALAGTAGLEAAAVPTIAAAEGGVVAGAAGVGAATGAASLGSLAGVAPEVAAKVGTSLTEKLLLASVGSNAIAGLTSPSVRDIAAAKAGFYGAFYGENADGSKGGPIKGGGPAPAPKPAAGPAAPAQSSIPGVNIPGQVSTPAQGPAGNPASVASAQQQQLIPNIAYSGQPQPGQTPDFAVQGATPAVKPQLIPT